MSLAPVKQETLVLFRTSEEQVVHQFEILKALREGCPNLNLVVAERSLNKAQLKIIWIDRYSDFIYPPYTRYALPYRLHTTYTRNSTPACVRVSRGLAFLLLSVNGRPFDTDIIILVLRSNRFTAGLIK